MNASSNDKFIGKITYSRGIGRTLPVSRMLKAIRPVPQEQGVEIYEQTPVLTFQESTVLTLRIPNAQIKAKAIVLATNGYTGKSGYL